MRDTEFFVSNKWSELSKRFAVCSEPLAVEKAGEAFDFLSSFQATTGSDIFRFSKLLSRNRCFVTDVDVNTKSHSSGRQDEKNPAGGTTGVSMSGCDAFCHDSKIRTNILHLFHKKPGKNR